MVSFGGVRWLGIQVEGGGHQRRVSCWELAASDQIVKFARARPRGERVIRLCRFGKARVGFGEFPVVSHLFLGGGFVGGRSVEPVMCLVSMGVRHPVTRSIGPV